ncbi:hypothetical protein [Halolamina salina]
MTENTRPLNYTAITTVALRATSGFATCLAARSPDHRHRGRKRKSPDGGAGSVGNDPLSLKAASNVFSDMAITNAEATQSEQPPERSERIDLRALGAAQLPEAAATVEATIVGDVESTATIRLTLVETTWVVDVVLATGDLESVYDEAGPVPKPSTVPDWLAAACSELGLEEVTL